MKKSILFLFLWLTIFSLTAEGQGTLMPIPPHVNNYASGTHVRGYWFTAPIDFTITGLRVPPEAGMGLQSMQVVLIDDNPVPAWPTLIAGVTNLVHIPNAPNGVIQTVNIPILAGQRVGVLGFAGSVNSYSASATPFASNIGGNPIQLQRFGCQASNINVAPAVPANQIFWEMNLQIARIELYYQDCPDQPDTTYVTICQGQTYQVGTSSYSTSGTYVDVFPFVDHPNCDSNVVTVLTVNPTYTTYIDTAIYEGDSVTIAGIHHKFEGTYNYRWQTLLGCDSNFTLRLKVIPWKLDTNIVHICIGEKYYLDTVMYDRTGVYYDTFRYEWGHHFYRTVVTVHPLPIITITPHPESNDGIICIHDSLKLSATGAIYYEWEYITPKEELRFGDTTDKQTAYIHYDNTTIRVFGRDIWTCENTKDISIISEKCCQMFAPTAFSPNGDGLNDKLELYSRSIPKEFRMTVYNRLGQVVFVGNDISDKWDGTMPNGTEAPNDTYFYHITGKCSNFEPINMKGEITVIR